MPRPSPTQTSAVLSARLQARRPEIEQAALTRVYAVSDPTEAADPEYVEGLRAAVSAALDYSFAGIERGEERSMPLPAALLAQARLAARNGISLDTVLRRYFAGYTLLGDFLMQEAEDDSLLGGAALKRVFRAHAALFDRLIAAVTDEYIRESESRLDTPEQRRAERIERLLAGEFLDTPELQYDFDAHHLGVIAAGPGVDEAIRDLAKALDCRLLLIRRSEGTVWAWLGARRTLDVEDLERLVSNSWPVQVSLAIGEPRKGLDGWRLTHREAQAALQVMLCRPQPVTRCRDVILVSAVLRDQSLAVSLVETYLAPLDGRGDSGQVLRNTLRAYFTADRNIVAAAAALGVARHTVERRLRSVEAKLGQTLDMCNAQLQVALGVEELVTSFRQTQRVSHA